MNHPVTETLVDVQKEVQRKLGRNLLKLQQYELLMKKLVIEQQVSSYVDEQHDCRQVPSVDVSDKTLGTVKKKLMEGFLKQTDAVSNVKQDDSPPEGSTLVSVKTCFSIEMSAEIFAKTENQLCALVDLRNELVHHFLERFDISLVSGCLAAEAYLDDSLLQINESFEQLHLWANHMSDARRMMASLMATPAFEDFFVHGILPDGAGVNWPISSIVELLRDADSSLRKSDWTLLQDAIVWIQAREPEQTPKKYGCSSWRQVIHESGLFEIHKEKSELNGGTLIWYRSRP